jgi:hypothetical protein
MTMCGVTARAHVRAALAFAVAQLCTHPVAAQVETPTAMVGKKIAPIWKDEDGPMMESLDIIAKMDPDGKIKWALRCPDACPLAPAPPPFSSSLLVAQRCSVCAWRTQAGLRALGPEGVAEVGADADAQAVPAALRQGAAAGGKCRLTRLRGHPTRPPSGAEGSDRSYPAQSAASSAS